jgi:hypothetical protein
MNKALNIRQKSIAKLILIGACVVIGVYLLHSLGSLIYIFSPIEYTFFDRNVRKTTLPTYLTLSSKVCRPTSIDEPANCKYGYSSANSERHQVFEDLSAAYKKDGFKVVPISRTFDHVIVRQVPAGQSPYYVDSEKNVQVQDYMSASKKGMSLQIRLVATNDADLQAITSAVDDTSIDAKAKLFVESPVASITVFAEKR